MAVSCVFGRVTALTDSVYDESVLTAFAFESELEFVIVFLITPGNPGELGDDYAIADGYCENSVFVTEAAFLYRIRLGGGYESTRFARADPESVGNTVLIGSLVVFVGVITLKLVVDLFLLLTGAFAYRYVSAARAEFLEIVELGLKHTVIFEGVGVDIVTVTAGVLYVYAVLTAIAVHRKRGVKVVVLVYASADDLTVEQYFSVY